MAMRLHRQGIEAKAKAYLDSLMLDTSECSPVTDFPTHLGFYFFKCCIADDNVLIRAQTWIYVLEDGDNRFQIRHYTTVCEHNDADGYQKSYRAAPLKIELQYNSIMTGKQSRYGHWDVLMDVIRRSGQKQNGHIIIIIQWQSLGSGRAPREL